MYQISLFLCKITYFQKVTNEPSQIGSFLPLAGQTTLLQVGSIALWGAGLDVSDGTANPAEKESAVGCADFDQVNLAGNAFVGLSSTVNRIVDVTALVFEDF
ncbi:hypothetical protein SAMN03080601_00608 [Alkalitalea saponilacus]|uniref:Uncharacterized protein n=1 Tax=Alkalitalea saponilacus TaxID=889453 RepID=A0A1T5BTG0_9BACT|nr:hypothetical protein [Alkalitalea saponilacus]SKB50170.1 hypothetical protein SAMN03080601_00608 [Alkalitalea saponilacus]